MRGGQRRLEKNEPVNCEASRRFCKGQDSLGTRARSSVLRDNAEIALHTASFSWGYEFAGLEFNLDFSELRHSKPEDAELDTVELSVSLSGACLDKAAQNDPFTHLSVNIAVHGLSKDAEPLLSAWHLDKHQGDESLFDHPNYHFHHGGRKIWEWKDFDYGSHLLLESPRLDHKPLDGILAVNFVLANFAGAAWQTLKAEEARYMELIHDAEKRCHLAYAHASLERLQKL